MIRKIVNDPLVRGSVVLMIAFGAFNVLNFVFHIAMARALTTVDYGILATLFSIMYVMYFFAESIQTIIAKYSSAQNSDGKIAALLRKSLYKARYPSVIAFLAYLAISLVLASILEIPLGLLALNGLMIFGAFYLPITRGILQGRRKFRALGGSMIVEAGIKIILAVVLVWAGWHVYGALVGIILGALGAYIISVLTLRSLSRTPEEPADTAHIYTYSKSTFVIIMGLTLFYGLDIILARALFDSTQAGIYSIASVLAKTIFLGTQPISKAMFPLTAESSSQDHNKKRLLIKSMSLLVPVMVIALLIFYFFPHFILSIFSGREIPDAAKILFLLGIGASLISLSNLLLLYQISRNAVRGSILIFIPVALQLIVLPLFSDNIIRFSIAFVMTCLTLFVISVIMTAINPSAR